MARSVDNKDEVIGRAQLCIMSIWIAWDGDTLLLLVWAFAQ